MKLTSGFSGTVGPSFKVLMLQSMRTDQMRGPVIRVKSDTENRVETLIEGELLWGFLKLGDPQNHGFQN